MTRILCTKDARNLGNQDATPTLAVVQAKLSRWDGRKLLAGRGLGFRLSQAKSSKFYYLNIS